jgi:hypothetical protein
VLERALPSRFHGAHNIRQISATADADVAASPRWVAEWGFFLLIRLELSGLGLDLTARVAADGAIASPTSGHNRGLVPPAAPQRQQGS